MPPSSSHPRHGVARQRELEAKAHHLRHDPTVTEQRLWSAGSTLCGCRGRREAGRCAAATRDSTGWSCAPCAELTSGCGRGPRWWWRGRGEAPPCGLHRLRWSWVLMPPLAPAAGSVSPRSVLARRAAGCSSEKGAAVQRRVVLRADGGDGACPFAGVKGRGHGRHSKLAHAGDAPRLLDCRNSIRGAQAAAA
jgi:hypothetical protein